MFHRNKKIWEKAQKKLVIQIEKIISSLYHIGIPHGKQKKNLSLEDYTEIYNSYPGVQKIYLNQKQIFFYLREVFS